MTRPRKYAQDLTVMQEGKIDPIIGHEQAQHDGGVEFQLKNNPCSDRGAGRVKPRSPRLALRT
jgi:hypothetical protein